MHSPPNDVPVLVKRLPHGEGLDLPAYATEGAAGMDAISAEDVTIPPGGRHAVGAQRLTEPLPPRRRVDHDRAQHAGVAVALEARGADQRVPSHGHDVVGRELRVDAAERQRRGGQQGRDRVALVGPRRDDRER